MSKRFSLNVIDWKKIAIGGGLALIGALLTYLSSVITTIDFGEFTPVVTALWAIVANIVRKFVLENTYSQE